MSARHRIRKVGFRRVEWSAVTADGICLRGVARTTKQAREALLETIAVHRALQADGTAATPKDPA